MASLTGRTFAAACFLLLCGVVALWVRSYRIEDRSWLITYKPYATGEYRHEYGLEIWRGRIKLAHQRCVPQDYMDEPHFFLNHEPADVGGFDAFAFYGGRTIVGFGYLSFYVDRGGTHGGNEERDRERDVIFPLWFVALALAVPAARWACGAWRRTRGARRERLGLCAACGYDLRASHERCPECGVAIPTHTNLAQSSWGRELTPLGLAAVCLLTLAATTAAVGLAWFQSQCAAWDRHVQITQARAKAVAAAYQTISGLIAAASPITQPPQPPATQYTPAPASVSRSPRTPSCACRRRSR